MKERPRGQIIPRGDRTWLVRVYIGQSPAGKKRYSSVTVHGARRVAEAKRTELLRESDTGTAIEPSRVTVQAFLEDWMDAKAITLGPKTVCGYRDRLLKDVYPFVGHLRLSLLDAQKVQTLYGSLLSDRNLSPRTVRYTHSILRQALQRAVHRKLIRVNPCDPAEIELPAKRRTEMAALTPQETATFLDATSGTTYGTLWRLLLTTGLRPQEAHALTWEDLTVDGGHSILSIRRALVEVSPGTYEAKPYMKTSASARTVGLSSETADALLRLKREQAARILEAGPTYARDGYVFTTKTGRPLDFTTARRAWKRDLTKAGVRTVRYYDARHTHLTHLLSAGVNAKAVAARAGHTDAHVLLSTYAHVLPEVAAGAADVVERQFDRARAQGAT